jgi:signal transduction histidine kinase
MGRDPSGRQPPDDTVHRPPGPDGAARDDASFPALLRSFWSARTWAATANIAVSLVAGVLFASATVAALLAWLGTAWIIGLGLLTRSATLRLTAVMAGLDLRRLAWLGARIEPLPLPAPEPGASLRQRHLAWTRARWLWRLPAYQLVRLPLAGALAMAAVAWWWAVIACFVLAAGPAGQVALLWWRVGPVSPGAAGAAALVLAGLAGSLAWPRLARAALGIDALAARQLLSPGRSRELAAEVSRLSAARAFAVESAQAERRRIERDLHDGLQPQLVSLALGLGLARARLERDPGTARQMIDQAHQEAKQASADLRNLVRGIHPAVLDERGLDAALSALVAGCAVPVSVRVSTSQPGDPTRQVVAYFVAAEAITNVTKHAGARQAAVTVEGAGGMLRVVVEDDGHGGASIEPGGGLAGLAARVASVDGIFTVSSPPGGPTRVEAVIPCGP